MTTASHPVSSRPAPGPGPERSTSVSGWHAASLRLAASGLLLALASGCAASGADTASLPWAEAPHAEWTSDAGMAFQDTVHALVVFVRFSDDTGPAAEWAIEETAGGEAIPDWGRDLVKGHPAEVNTAMSLWDRSLSAYWFWQSQGGESPHVLTGETWPQSDGAPHVYVPRRPSAGYAAGRGQGYGYLVEEVLDTLATNPSFDIGRFDANRDGELDHLMLIVRRDPAVPVVGGVAALQGVSNARVRTRGAPSRSLRYPTRNGEVVVDLTPFGSGTINWIGGEWSVRTLAHEYGHILLDMGHTSMITPARNDVPFDVPASGGGAYACQYNRMCGGGADSRGRPTESSNYDGTLTLSGFEIRRLGWARRQVIDPTTDRRDVRLAPLYGTSEVALIPLGAGSAGDTLSLEYRRRANGFDAFPPQETDNPFYGRIYRDLPAEGLLVTLSHGEPTGPPGRYLYDFVPPSNRLVRAGSRCDGTSDGCAGPYAPWRDDMLRPDGISQITPWTRPNVSGYTHYPAGVEPNWFAVTDVRQVDDQLAFDVIADVRRSAFTITADSWMGVETDGVVFREPVRVANGATLRVGEGATVSFSGGLAVEPGAQFVCEPGATCRGVE